jgi:hypothetical protein
MTMYTVKQMPNREKLELVEQNRVMVERVARTFVQEKLGEEALQDLEARWLEGVTPLPGDGSWGEQYEIAFGNLMHVDRSLYAMVRERMGVAGLAELVQAMAKALKEENASPAVWMLGLIRKLMPGRAFRMTAEQFAYTFQWLTPFTVEALDEQQAVYDIPRCKVLENPDTEDLCVIACQQVYPRWIAEQFGVKMLFDRRGKACTLTVSPLA